MKILLITQSYLPILGGLQQIVADLAQDLIANGHEVRIVAQRHPRTLPEHEIIKGIPVHRFYFVRPAWSHVRRGRLDQFGAGLITAPRTEGQLRALIAEFHPDVIHFHYPQHLSSFVLAARSDTSASLIVSFHGVEVEAAQSGTAQDRQLLRALLDSADQITSVSQDALNQVIAFSPGIAEKTAVVPNGLHDEAFRIPETYHHARPYIFAAGRLVLPKGFDRLIDAFNRLSSDFPDLDLLIAGDGDARATFEEQVLACDLTERVHFLGNVPRAEIARLIRGSRFVVVPSLTETFGLIALEAMALERKVIAANVGGLPELVPPTDNQLVSSTSDSLYAALRRWLSDPSFAPRSPSNRAHAERFTIAAMQSRYETLYRQAAIMITP